MKPLEDIRIIAIEQFGAGPFGSLLLADLGADVIKIEDPTTGGDVGRYVPPFQDGEDSLFFETFNRNKKSLSLDIANPTGRGVFEDLVRVSDAVSSNLRGDVVARLRLRYEDLKGINPAIVCCSLSGYGFAGPRAADPAYDYILQGLAGWMSLTGDPEAPPARSGLPLVDYSGGLAAAIALLAGIHAARRDGVGMDCDLSLFDVAIGLLAYLATWHLTAGFEPVRTRSSAHPSLVPFQSFQTADGWIVAGCAKEKFWERLAVAIGRPELAADPRFRTFADRHAHADELIPVLEEVFRSKPSADWLTRLKEAGVPSGPINSVRAALRDPHVAARDLIVEVTHPRFGVVGEIASPVRVGDEGPSYRRAPRRNEDADYVLESLLGYAPRRIADLRAAGAFGPPDGTSTGGREDGREESLAG